MRFRAVVVENEELSRARIVRLLMARSADVEIVGEAVDGPSAVDLIQAQRPDLLFLDIELPGLNGFEVLDAIDLQPAVIFTTAYHQHALDAFKTYAIDYLLKPIGPEGVARALDKLQRVGFNQDRLSAALRNLFTADGERHVTRIPCRVGDRTLLVKTGEILYFRSDNKYTCVATLERELLIDTPLIDLERKLDPREFIRVHRSAIVNVSWIAELRRAYNGKTSVVLRDAKARELPVGRAYVDALRNL